MKKMKVFLASLMSLFILTGCEEKKPSICTTVYPVQYLAQRIGDKYVDVSNISKNDIIQRAQIKKDYQATLKDADALFYINGLEPYMELYMDKVRAMDVEMVNLATKSAIYKFERYTTVTVDGKTTGIASAYYAGEEFSSVDKYNADPLLWMDPVAMTSMASDIRDYLIAKYPQYEKIFNTNFDELELDLARLDADFQTIPNEKMDISFVSMTPSFGIWQRSYGVKVYPISLSKYGALPTSDQLTSIKKRIIRDKVRYIAVEQNLPQDMKDLQNTLIEELGLIPVTLHNLSSYSKEDLDAGKDYLTIMYENLKALQSIAS
ncbi:metal ABC transporter substrate-binding protein [Amedibacillus sp. YH-ame10]